MALFSTVKFCIGNYTAARQNLLYTLIVINSIIYYIPTIKSLSMATAVKNTTLKIVLIRKKTLKYLNCHRKHRI